MNITDVPGTAVYIQKGAIFQLVAQILDFTTGLPIQLQTATGLSISVLYPDGVATQTFAASLYTDGSDGKIVYTTKNDGALVVDLSQVGLYHFQGNAAVGSVQLPPSYQSDFYVLENVVGSGPPAPLFTSAALILFDTAGIRWGTTVSVAGALVTVLTPTGPAAFLQFNQLVMKDPNGLYWTVTVSVAGVLETALGGDFTKAVGSFILTDSTGNAWVVTVDVNGVLVTA